MSGRIVTLGEALGVLRTTGPGSLAQLGTLVVGTGGAEGNVAIGAARLGAPVSWHGRVGDDGLGRRVVRELRAEGVEVHAIVDPAAPTGLLIKETPAPGRTAVSYYRTGSAGSRLTAADLELYLGRQGLEPEDILHLTGITPALSASARDAVLYAISLAEQAGAAVSYDVNHRSRLWSTDDAVPVHRALIARATIVFAGDDEARLVAGSASEDPGVLAEALAALGPAEVVVKLGTGGALALVDGEQVRVPAVPVSAVDTVGAGDAFVAGYLAERLAGLPAAARLATATRAGAAACLHPGDWEGAPTRAELAAGPWDDPVIR
ncbi:MAG: sugar kinase [Microbacteriaceae bacterium]